MLWGGSWWDATALESRGQTTKIHYRGWGPEWDEWVESSRIRNAPPPLTNPRVGIDVEIEWKGSPDAKAFFGGPVQSNVGSTLFSPTSDEETLDDRIVTVAPGLRLSQDVRILKDLALDPPPGFRFILGCAGWDAGQLEEELGRNDWLLVPFTADLIFRHAAEDMWGAALRSIGVRPESLPALNISETGEAN